jgi:putative salt-induced outer membrane protein
MKFSTLATLLSAAIACMGAGSAFAQAKTDGQWRGLAGASVAATSGNSSTNNVLLNVDMARLTASDKISAGAFANYGSSKDAGVTSTTSNKWGLAGQYDYNLTPRLYGFGKLALEGDQVIKLSNRRTLAAGLGYKVIDEAKTTFDVFGGVANIHSKYSQNRLIGNTTSDSFSTNSLLLGEESTHKLSETVFFKQRVELYPRISGDGGTFAKGTANLGVSLNSALSLNVGLVDNYNSAPGNNLKKNDLALFTGVSMNLGK